MTLLNPKSEDSPPASLEFKEAQRIPCRSENVAGIEVGEYTALNSRNPSWSISMRKRRRYHTLNLSSLSYSSSKRGFTNFPETVLRFREIRETLSSLGVSVSPAVLGGW